MKKPIKMLIFSLFALLFAVLSVIPALADDGGDLVRINYNYNMRRSDSYGRLVDGTTYFHIRAFSDENGAVSVDWNEKSRTATVKCARLTVDATVGEPYIVANGRVIYSGKANFTENGKLYVPSRSICKAFGFDIFWDEQTRTVTVDNHGTPIEDADSFYNANDLYWLSRIISAEAGGTEPLVGQIAVGNVVLNRVRDEMAPDSIYEVIFDKRFGVQFTPAYTPEIYKEPFEISVIAAKICLEGYSVSEDALFFYAPKYVYAAWIEENREYLFTIGGHKFFA